MPPYTPSTDVDAWQDAIVALAEWACGYDKKRSKDDPIYIMVTEGRDGPTPEVRKNYSSCGDQGNWILERLGLREKWINRKSLGQYVTGANVTRLGLGCPIAKAPPNTSDSSWRPLPGTICEIWNTGFDAHVFVILGPGSDANHVRTANYGAGGMSPSAFPGADIADSPFVARADGWYVGLVHPRKLQRMITAEDASKLSKVAPDLTGCNVTGDVIDALGATFVAQT